MEDAELPRKRSRVRHRQADERPPPIDRSQIVQQQWSSSSDVAYTQDERLLNEFIKIHPMLSGQSLQPRTLTLVAKAAADAPVRIAPLEVCGRCHDDGFLREADEEAGERPCALGARCVCKFLGAMRHGSDDRRAFVCREFLLPSVEQRFKSGQGLPAHRAKCLLCTRYFLHYLYLLSRADSTFRPGRCSAAAFENSIAYCPEQARCHDEEQLKLLTCVSATMANAPASVAGTSDGYPPSAMLFVDETVASTDQFRLDPAFAALFFRPVVRFSSTHYTFRVGQDGRPLIEQSFPPTASSTAAFGPPPLNRVRAGRLEPTDA